VGVGEQAGLLSHDRYEDCRALHRVEGIREVNATLAVLGCEVRAARRTCPMPSALLVTPTPSWSDRRLGSRSGVAAREYGPHIRIHTSVIAIGCTPPVGFVVATRQHSSICGRCARQPLTMAFTMCRRGVMQAVSKSSCADVPICPSAGLGYLALGERTQDCSEVA
jgi:hypothetical protein